MRLYYKRETLYIEINCELNEEEFLHIKRKIFRIVDEYDIDHIILQSASQNKKQIHLLYQLEKEYKQNYKGRFLIR